MAPTNNGSGDEIDVISLLNFLFKRRKLIAGLVLTSMVIASVIMLLTPNVYMSRATILPSGKSDKFSALRAMVGLGSGLVSSDENSSALYPVILSSDQVRDAIIAKEYRFVVDGKDRTTTLAEYFGTDDINRLREALASVTSVDSDNRTGKIALQVETEYPALSQMIGAEFIDRLEKYNLHKRRSSAKNNEKYLETQLDEASVKLAEAEDALQAFRTRNVNWAESSDAALLMTQARMRRDIEIRNAAYLFLQEQYEMAKLEVQKDVPIVRILDQPSLPTRKSGPRRTMTVAAVGAGVFVLALVGIVLTDLTRQFIAKSNQDSLERLSDNLSHAFPRATRLYDGIRQRLTRESVSIDN